MPDQMTLYKLRASEKRLAPKKTSPSSGSQTTQHPGNVSFFLSVHRLYWPIHFLWRKLVLQNVSFPLCNYEHYFAWAIGRGKYVGPSMDFFESTELIVKRSLSSSFLSENGHFKGDLKWKRSKDSFAEEYYFANFQLKKENKVLFYPVRFSSSLVEFFVIGEDFISTDSLADGIF